MILKDILEKKPFEVITITQDQTADKAVKLMVEKKVSDIIIVDDNDKIAGIFTERDVVRCVNDGVSLATEPLRNVMSKKVTTFAPSTEVSIAIQVVAKEKIRHLPVVEGEKLIGMITYRDLVAHVLPEIIFMAESIY